MSQTNNTHIVSPGTSAATVNALIVSAAAGDIILLEDGQHDFTETIVINRSDITLKGESEAGTILSFDFPTGTEDHSIKVSSGSKQFIGAVAQAVTAGDTTVEISGSHSIQADDTLYITLPNTIQYLLDNGWTNVSWEDADDRPFREVIVEVVSVAGNTITLEQEMPYDMDAMLAEIHNITLRDNICLSDFTMCYDLGPTSHPSDFENNLPAYKSTAAIYFKGTHNAALSNITIENAPSNAFDLRVSLKILAEHLTVDGSYNKGGSGNGYGLQIYETFDSSFTSLEMMNVRHAVLFSSWHAESLNFVQVDKTNRDINFHGSPDVNNTVLVTESILDYDPTQNTGSTHGY